MSKKDWVLISDLDGIFTSSCFTYTIDGKAAKTFSANDAHVAKLVIPLVKDFKIITGETDETGFAISLKRMKDVGLDKYLVRVASKDKYSWIKENYGSFNVAYFGDDIFDLPIFNDCAFSATTSSALPILRDSVVYESPQKGGEDAFADMALHFAETQLYIQLEKTIS